MKEDTMPIVQFHTVDVTELKQGDVFPNVKGIDVRVARTRTMSANVEVHFTDGTSRRIRKGTTIKVEREVLSRDEERANIVGMLTAATDKCIDEMHRTCEAGDKSIRNRLATVGNLTSELEWHVEDMLVELHQLALVELMAGVIDREDDPCPVWERLLSFMDYLDKVILDWTPSRSTSAMHNISNECKLKALHVMTGRHGIGAFRLASVQYWAEKLADHDKEAYITIVDGMEFNDDEGE
jgi:hypothetical protein